MKISKEKQLKKLLHFTDEMLNEIVDNEFLKSEDEINVDLIMFCSDILHQRQIKKAEAKYPKVQKSLSYLNEQAIHELMSGEWEKPVDEIDSDFVILCHEALDKRGSQKLCAVPKKHISKKTVIKMVAVAAVVSILVATLSFVFADTKGSGFNFNHVKVASFDKQTLALDYTNMDVEPDGYFLPESENLKELKASGIDQLLLPEVLFNGEYEMQEVKTERRADKTELACNVLRANFVKPDVSVSVLVTKYDDFFFLDYDEENRASGGGFVAPRSGEEIVVNGMDVIMIGFKRSNYYVQYFDRAQKATYTIDITSTYEQAKEIVGSIK